MSDVKSTCDRGGCSYDNCGYGGMGWEWIIILVILFWCFCGGGFGGGLFGCNR